MWEFWYYFLIPKYKEKVRLCYIDTDSFIVYIKTEGIYSDISKDVGTKFYILSYELRRLIPRGKIQNIIGLIIG